MNWREEQSELKKHPTINNSTINCIMTRFSSIPFFAAVLVLANFMLSSSAVQTFDLGKQGEAAIIFNENDIVVAGRPTILAKFPRRSGSHGFIGNLVVGEDNEGDDAYLGYAVIPNPNDEVKKLSLKFTVPNKTIVFVGVGNEPDSFAVMCDTPETLGSSTSVVNVRVPANSTANLIVVVGAH